MENLCDSLRRELEADGSVRLADVDLEKVVDGLGRLDDLEAFVLDVIAWLDEPRPGSE